MDGRWLVEFIPENRSREDTPNGVVVRHRGHREKNLLESLEKKENFHPRKKIYQMDYKGFREGSK